MKKIILYAFILSCFACGRAKKDEDNNLPPVINQIIIESGDSDQVPVGDTVELYCDAIDPENAELSYYWEVDAGELHTNNEHANWSSPETSGVREITCTVSDGENQDIKSLYITFY